ncbi:MAG: hypothetical protein AAGD05_18535, partial [Bacteroidota bacterium]
QALIDELLNKIVKICRAINTPNKRIQAQCLQIIGITSSFKLTFVSGMKLEPARLINDKKDSFWRFCSSRLLLNDYFIV